MLQRKGEKEEFKRKGLKGKFWKREGVLKEEKVLEEVGFKGEFLRGFKKGLKSFRGVLEGGF